MKLIATITLLPGKVETWRVDVDGHVHLAISPEEALDAVLSTTNGRSVSVSWVGVPQDFDPPGWDGRLDRLPPSAIA